MKGYMNAHTIIQKKLKDKPWECAMREALERCRVGARYSKLELEQPEIQAIKGGYHMEESVTAIQQLTQQFAQAKQELRDMVHEIAKLNQIIAPALELQIKNIREHRFAATSETKQILGELRDIRKFFLESDYQKEMERLRLFVDLCRELKALKADGTLDAICDSALHLAIKEKP